MFHSSNSSTSTLPFPDTGNAMEKQGSSKNLWAGARDSTYEITSSKSLLPNLMVDATLGGNQSVIASKHGKNTLQLHNTDIHVAKSS